MQSPNVACPFVMPVEGPIAGVLVVPDVPDVLDVADVPEPVVPVVVLPGAPPVVPVVDAVVEAAGGMWSVSGWDACEARWRPTAAATDAKPKTPTAEAAAILKGTNFLRMGVSFDGAPVGATSAAAAETTLASRLSSAGRAGPRATRTNPATAA